MKAYYIDEIGFTGEDLLAEDQPIFVQTTNDFSNEEAKQLIEEIFSGLGSKELKHNRLVRNGRHHDKIVDLVRTVANDPRLAGA